MAQVPPEFEPLDDWQALAGKIVEKFSAQLNGIDLEKVRAVAITNKERSDSNDKLFEIKAVPDPIRMDCKYAFYVIFYRSDWDMFDEKHKALLVLKTLIAIPIDDNGEMEEGKVKAYDLKDFAILIRSFGADYLVRDDVPDILADEIKLKDVNY
jgi:hypothetical protein